MKIPREYFITSFSSAKEFGVGVADEALVEDGHDGCAPWAASRQASGVAANSGGEAAATVSTRVARGAHGDAVHRVRAVAGCSVEEAAILGHGVLRKRGEELVEVGGVGTGRGVVAGC